MLRVKYPIVDYCRAGMELHLNVLSSRTNPLDVDLSLGT
jgi:hypothetical protein